MKKTFDLIYAFFSLDCPGFHEEYSFCNNHPCRSTCKNPDLEEKCSFIPGCYSGCVCRVGYLRDDNGRCVSQRKCRKH